MNRESKAQNEVGPSNRRTIDCQALIGREWKEKKGRKQGPSPIHVAKRHNFSSLLQKLQEK